MTLKYEGREFGPGQKFGPIVIGTQDDRRTTLELIGGPPGRGGQVIICIEHRVKHLEQGWFDHMLNWLRVGRGPHGTWHESWEPAAQNSFSVKAGRHLTLRNGPIIWGS